MYTIRQATLEDADAIAQRRRGMFLDIGFADDDLLKRKIEEFRPWLQTKWLRTNTWRGSALQTARRWQASVCG
jgi:hypothetical protein